MDTVVVLGDQLNRSIGALAGADPSSHRILMVESRNQIESRPIHRQRLHLVLTAMRRFATELENEGFAVDYRQEDTLASGIRSHVTAFAPDRISCTSPNSRSGRRTVERLGLDQVASNQFLCQESEFEAWAKGRRRLRMEDFYRWQRTRLGYLMDDDQPVGGRWNLDAENREPPPDDPSWPAPLTSDLDGIDREVLAGLPPTAFGADPDGTWATDRSGALARLEHFVDRVLPSFGPHEDAMLGSNWHLAHSLLSPYLNLGLLMPGEVCDAVQAAYDRGGVPLNSAEGFIRQVIGWREYVWGLYWLWPDHARANALGNDQPIPPVFVRWAKTEMRCLDITLEGLHDRAWVHHIERLMILSNLFNLLAVDPAEVYRWMSNTYVDAAEWVMVPNVFGMGMWADGGLMATKPYVSGGAYINRMSDHCTSCRFDPTRRTGEDACPFTSLYWDFLARNEAVLESNHRIARALAGMRRLSDLEATRERARSVRERLASGEL